MAVVIPKIEGVEKPKLVEDKGHDPVWVVEVPCEKGWYEVEFKEPDEAEGFYQMVRQAIDQYYANRRLA